MAQRDMSAETPDNQKQHISKERLQLALEATSDALWDWDVITGEAYFSPRYYTMLGYEPGEFEPGFAAWEQIVHPDDLQLAKDLIFAHIERGEPFDVEFRLRNKAGDWQWVLGRGKIVERDEQGRPTRMVGTHVDIHERKTVSESLRQRSEELAALNALTDSVALSLSLHDVIDAALDNVMHAIQPDLALLYLAKGDILELKGVRGKLTNFDLAHKQQHKKGECLCGLAALSETPLFSLSIQEDARCTHAECKAAGIVSYASLPLRRGADIIGVLGLGSLRSRDFSARGSFLQSVASLVATGVTNAILHQQALDHAQELEAKVEQRTAALMKFSNAVEHSHASIVITDSAGGIEYVNPAFTRLTGYTLEEAQGKNPRIMQSGRHDTAFYKAMWETLLDKRTWRGELLNRKKDGSLYWEDATISPLLDSQGRITHFVAVKEDISQQKASEAALRESETRYRTIFEFSRDGILVADIESRRFLFANNAICTLLGYEREDLLNLGVEDIHPPDELDHVLQDFKRQATGELAYAIELPCLHKSGKVFYCDVSATPVLMPERTCLMGFFRDVSERRQAAQLREHVDRVLRHDLKGPLNGVINLPELLLDRECLDETDVESLHQIMDAGRHILDMINSSLDLYKMETGAYTYTPGRMDFARTLRRLSGDVQALCARGKVSLRVELQGRPLDAVESFPVRAEELLLYSMLSNLLTNAVEASPPDEEVLLQIRNHEPMTIEICNKGLVPPAIQDRFFEKYVTYGKPGGTGLGTYSARLMAETMGGSIAMHTNEVAGTCVRVTLPLFLE